MKTLKEAITHAGNEADLVVEQVWAETFLASLESNGYCIAPLKATGEMNQAGMKAIADALEEGLMLCPDGVFNIMLTVRPKIGD